MREVIPLMPVEVSNKEAHGVQDCELAAAKRLIMKIREDHPKLEFILNDHQER